MAKIQPPKKGAKKGTKGAPPSENKPSKNLHKPETGDLVALNFKVDAEFKKNYKLYAIEQNMSMVDLLRKTYEFYKENQ